MANVAVFGRPKFKLSHIGKEFANYAVLEPSLSSLSMWQDAAGTTAVTATGQVVGYLWGNNPIEQKRRNILTWTEDLSNSAWNDKYNVTATSGGVRETSAAAEHYIAQKTITRATTSAYSTYFEVKIKPDGRTNAHLTIYESSTYGHRAFFDLTGSGSVTSYLAISVGLTNVAATINYDSSDGYYRCSLTVTIPTGSTQTIGYYIGLSTGGQTLSYEGDTSKGLLIKQAHAAVFVSSDTYQRIDAGPYPYGADLTKFATQATTANKPTYQVDARGVPVLRHDTTDVLTMTAASTFGSAASVYYANQWGVQQSHGVNVGTSYNLPGKPSATSDDVYSYIVTPSRPSAKLENNIVKYLEKKMGVRRRNYLTYTNALTGTGWTLSANTSLTTGQADSLGGTDGFSIACSSTVSTSRANFYTLTLPTSTSFTYRFFIKRLASSTWHARLNIGNSLNSWFNPVTGAMGTTAAGVTATVTDLGGGWYMVDLVNTTTVATNYYTLGISAGDTAISSVGVVGEGIAACFCGVYLTSEPDKSYQRIDAGPGVPA